MFQVLFLLGLTLRSVVEATPPTNMPDDAGCYKCPDGETFVASTVMSYRHQAQTEDHKVWWTIYAEALSKYKFQAEGPYLPENHFACKKSEINTAININGVPQQDVSLGTRNLLLYGHRPSPDALPKFCGVALYKGDLKIACPYAQNC